MRQWLAEDDSLHEETLRERIEQAIAAAYEAKVQAVGAPVMRHVEKAIMLKVLDEQWKDHLANMDHLRQGIHLRGYAQKNPKQEYKRESFEMFSAMLDRVKHDVITLLSKIQVREESQVADLEEQRRSQQQMRFLHPEMSAASAEEAEAEYAQAAAGGGGRAARPSAGPAQAAQPFVRGAPKVGRNAPCPCGSGKKYKHCHGRLQ